MRLPISKDSKTQNQVAGILLAREAERLEQNTHTFVIEIDGIVEERRSSDITEVLQYVRDCIIREAILEPYRLSISIKS